jgi:hypothetical protein
VERVEVELSHCLSSREESTESVARIDINATRSGETIDAKAALCSNTSLGHRNCGPQYEVLS